MSGPPPPPGRARGEASRVPRRRGGRNERRCAFFDFEENKGTLFWLVIALVFLVVFSFSRKLRALLGGRLGLEQRTVDRIGMTVSDLVRRFKDRR